MVYIHFTFGGQVFEASYITPNNIDIIDDVLGGNCRTVWNESWTQCISVYDIDDVPELFEAVDAWENVERDSAEARGEAYTPSGVLSIRDVSAEFRANYPAL